MNDIQCHIQWFCLLQDSWKVGLKQGAAVERAAIVAWLRKQAEQIRYSQYDLDRHRKAGNLMRLAECIERGDHEQPRPERESEG